MPQPTNATAITTADRKVVTLGDRVFNHYDRKAGVIEAIDSHAQPDPDRGQSCSTPVAEWSNYWFTVRHDDGSRSELDGSRITTIAYAGARGWLA